MATGSDDWSLYSYDASQGAAIFFAVFLTVLGCYQIYQSFIRYRWKKFGGVMTWATTASALTYMGVDQVWISGFVCRSISIHYDQNINLYIAQFVLVLMGPPLYAAAEYFILSRLLAYLPYHAPIHPGRVLSTFILLSAVVESLTASGAANSAGTGRKPAQRKRGLDCLKAALIIQCLIESLFFSLVVVLERRCRKAGSFPKHVRVVVYVLYVTSLMVLVRCIVRTIEGFQAATCDEGGLPCGYIAEHEWIFFVFEISNISLFVVILAIFHPGRFLPRSSKIYLDPYDGKTERVGPGFGKADKRPFLVTAFDPFNLAGILTGKGMKLNKFWEEFQPIYNGGELIPVEHSATDTVPKAVAV
ncbi:hypothetical protein LTR17_013875 [Elasticomyces elasticus]|nr:hypothetical protein LTR17_013875 [Elasticomyces elasticus]